MKTVLRALLLVLLSAALGMALLVGVYALPKDAMRSMWQILRRSSPTRAATRA